ncbi:conserved hypothetical protein [Capnocytophaga canimorsus]|nr:conserved hypothetical protein [Capnocytophaga canimorsus]
MMLYFDLISANFWSITIAVVVSTFVVILITGHTYQFFRKKMKP